MVRTLQGFSQEPSVHKVSGVFARASPARGDSAPLRSAASQSRKSSRRKGRGSEGGVRGRLGRPALGRRPGRGLAGLPAWRPPLCLGFASAIPAGWLPGPPAALTPPFLFLPAARWGRARPPPRSLGATVPRRRPGRGGSAGGRGRGGRPSCAEDGKKGRRGAAGTCSPRTGSPELSLGRSGARSSPSHPAPHPVPAAFTRPLKLAATGRATLTPRALGALAVSASTGSRARTRGAQRRGRGAATHRRSRKQVYSYSNKRTNCARRGEGASNRLARGPGAALHKAIFCVGASGVFACGGVISGFEKRTVARPHFPLWFRRRRKCFAGG